MEKDCIAWIRGKSLFITKLSLYVDEETLQMLWEFICNDCRCTAVFNNVSRINMINNSYPLQISDMKIVNNKENGWDRDSSYFVRDFEEQQISFYCESFKINAPFISS